MCVCRGEEKNTPPLEFRKKINFGKHTIKSRNNSETFIFVPLYNFLPTPSLKQHLPFFLKHVQTRL